MAIQVGGTTVINDSRNLVNVGGLKTVNGSSILGSGDISVGSSIPESASMTTFPVGSYAIQFTDSNSANGFTNSSGFFDTISASASTPVRLTEGGYSYTYVNYGTWAYMSRIYSVSGTLVCRVA